jgi:hypothetical protein
MSFYDHVVQLRTCLLVHSDVRCFNCEISFLY